MMTVMAKQIMNPTSKTNTLPNEILRWNMGRGYSGEIYLSNNSVRDLHPWEYPQVMDRISTTPNAKCTAGIVDYDRPGFDLPGMPFETVGADECSTACILEPQCMQWAWSPGKCWLKNLVGPRVQQSGFCSDTRLGNASAPELFPVGNYTPFGYLQNPYHRVRHASGHLRSDDTLNGLGWFYPWYNKKGSNYMAVLAVSARPNGLPGSVLITEADFRKAGIERVSTIHTKTRLVIVWTINRVRYSVEYWQVAEDIFACKVILNNTNTKPVIAAVDILLSVVKRNGATVSGSFTNKDSTLCLDVQGPGVGTQPITKLSPVGNRFFSNSTMAASELSQKWTGGGSSYSGTGGSAVGTITYNISLLSSGKNGSIESLLFVVGRAETCATTINMFHDSDLTTKSEVINQLIVARESDNRFWAGSPTLSGDWPSSWKHGVIYDLNTVRLNLRPAVGIFTTQWDAMQTAHPRIVVAESTMDFLALSYADLPLAQKVLLGLFQDAIAPNVPCVWEDGTPNMVCDDGSVSGTPPAWGGPFVNILSIYRRGSDKKWLAKMYPYLASYLDFWLTKRKLGDYQSCRCSWECGQDDEPRWGWNQTSGGAITNRFRVVEMQAATAHAAAVLKHFAQELDLPLTEIERWAKVVSQYVNLTLSLWDPTTYWFADYDTITKDKSSYGQWNMQLAPLFFHDPALGVDLFPTGSNINASRLADTIVDPEFFFSDPPALAPKATYCNHTVPQWGKDRCWTVSGQFRPAHDPIRLDRVWAPSPWIMGGGAATVGRIDIASNFTERTLNTVYNVMDKRSRESNLPLPGVAYECWDTAMMVPTLPKVSNYAMAEAYGWSSVNTVLLLRNVIGFKELSDELSAFELSPALPMHLLMSCPRTFVVDRIQFQYRTFRLSYKKNCDLKENLAGVVSLQVQLVELPSTNDIRNISAAVPIALFFNAVNGMRYRVSVADPPTVQLL